MKNKRSKFDFKLFLSIIILLGIIAVLSVAVIRLSGDDTSSQNSTSSSTSSQTAPVESEVESQVESFVPGLDPDFEKLLLVNGENPLPADYDYEGNLTTIPKEYIKGSLTQFDKDVWPYLKAMLDKARADGVDIGVWSPYRSYSTQSMLFNRQIERQKANGVPTSEAEDKAATIVARPGTSEHHTGLALDINCADDKFEQQEAYTWLKENAEDFGFIMRYEEDKQPITGVIKESWHWRFVGIRHAKKMNSLGLCLEEYVEQLSSDN